MDRKRAAILRAADGNAVVTHTTAIVAGVEGVHIRVINAQSEQAELHTNFGPFFLIFRNAAAVHGFISAFASARPLLSEVEVKVTAPSNDHPDDFALATLAVVYLESPDYRITRVSR